MRRAVCRWKLLSKLKPKNIQNLKKAYWKK